MPARISSTALAGARYRSHRVLRCRQGPGVEFAVGVSGSASITTTAAGTIGRPSRSASWARISAGPCPGDITHQPLVAGAVLAGDHHRLPHPRQPASAAHLTQFDAIPADLDLLIGAPQILQLPISTPHTRSPVRYIRAPGPRTDRPQTATRSTRPDRYSPPPHRDRPHTTPRPPRTAPAATSHPAQTTPRPPAHRSAPHRSTAVTAAASTHTRWPRWGRRR